MSIIINSSFFFFLRQASHPFFSFLLLVCVERCSCIAVALMRFSIIIFSIFLFVRLPVFFTIEV